MIVHFLQRIRPQDPADYVARHGLAAGISVSPRKSHRCDVILAERRSVGHHGGRHIHSVFAPGRL
jgi:hypothetical protein